MFNIAIKVNEHMMWVLFSESLLKMPLNKTHGSCNMKKSIKSMQSGSITLFYTYPYMHILVFKRSDTE